MKNPCFRLAAVGLILPCHAAPMAHEPFDYPAASSLTAGGGGSGWADAWYQDGEPVIAGEAGLGFTDAEGNVLNASGRSADTTAGATSRSLRIFSGGLLNDVWISFLYQLPASNSKFEGVSFYRGTQQVFSISNPSTTGTAAIHLANNLVSSNGTSTGHGIFGRTHFIALKLTKGGGTGGADRVEAYIDPVLTGDSLSPAAIINGTNFDVDRVRIAGQDGATLLVDELRVGETFEDVAPHDPAGGADSDGDGLSDARETVLGLDPNVNDSALIAAIQAHPDWFNLYSSAGILGLDNGGVVLAKTGDAPVDFIFEVQHSETLTSWPVLETFNRQVVLPAGKNFLRVTLEDR
jgi:hypothetical protein